ncbi:hypothetical protein D3C75_1230630 [compost metagenome]
MAPIGFIARVYLEEVQPVRLVFLRHRIDGQHARLKADRLGHFLFNRRLVFLQFGWVYFKLGNAHYRLHVFSKRLSGG